MVDIHADGTDSPCLDEGQRRDHARLHAAVGQQGLVARREQQVGPGREQIPEPLIPGSGAGCAAGATGTAMGTGTIASWAMSVSSASTSATVSPCSLRRAGRTSTVRYSASSASDTTKGNVAASMPSRMRATGDAALPVSRPATTTLVSTTTAWRLTTRVAPPEPRPGPRQWPRPRKLAVCPRTTHQLARVFARLDAIEVQTFVDQLPDGLVTTNGRLLQCLVACLGQGDGQTAHTSLTLVL